MSVKIPSYFVYTENANQKRYRVKRNDDRISAVTLFSDPRVYWIGEHRATGETTAKEANRLRKSVFNITTQNVEPKLLSDPFGMTKAERMQAMSSLIVFVPRQ